VAFDLVEHLEESLGEVDVPCGLSLPQLLFEFVLSLPQDGNLLQLVFENINDI